MSRLNVNLNRGEKLETTRTFILDELHLHAVFAGSLKLSLRCLERMAQEDLNRSEA